MLFVRLNTFHVANDERHARRDEEEGPAGASGKKEYEKGVLSIRFKVGVINVSNHVTVTVKNQRNIVTYDHQKSVTLKKKNIYICHQFLQYFILYQL